MYISFGNVRVFYMGHAIIIVILLIVTLDANNDIFPIVVCICKGKTTNDWKWFLQILFEQIEEKVTRRIMFMSNPQKGIIKVLSENSLASMFNIYMQPLYASMVV